MTTHYYSKVKKKYVAPHVIPHNSTAVKGDYSVLKRDDIPHVPLHNVTAEGDYSVIKRDDGDDYSVLKREEREVS